MAEDIDDPPPSALVQAADALEAREDTALAKAVADLLGKVPVVGKALGDAVAAVLRRRGYARQSRAVADAALTGAEDALMARFRREAEIVVAQVLAGFVADAPRPDPALLDLLGGLNAGFDALRAEVRAALGPRVHVDVQHIHAGAIGVAVGRAAVEEAASRAPARRPAVDTRLDRLLWDNDRRALAEGPSPANRLIAGARQVPFDDALHARELSRLATWCHDDAPSSLRLLHGRGGAGKTRLAIELADRQRARGWHAGFLREGATDLDDLTRGEHPRLVVVDYAEARPVQVARLLDLAARLHAVPGPLLRVLLLAREADADWWRLHRESGPGEVRTYLEARGAALRLDDLPDDLALRTRQFHRAVSAFGRGRSRATVPTPDLMADPFGLPLYLHLAAAAALDGKALSTARALLDHTLKREEDAWRKRWPDAADGQRRKRRVRATATTLAALTLRGAAPDEEAVARLAEAVAGVGGDDRDAVVEVLRAFYAAHARDHEEDGARGLEPDLLGEHLVERALTRDAALLGRTFPDANDPQVEHAFTVLARLGSRQPEATHATVAGWVRTLLTAAPAERFPLAVRAVLGTDGERASRPGDDRHRFWLDDVLAAVVHGGDLDPHLSVLASVVPYPSVTLRRTAAELSTRAADQDDLPDEERARRLNDASVYLAELGRRDDALAAVQGAVDIRRRLATARPDTFEPDLAASLSNLSNRLAAVGRRDDALAAVQEAVEVYRRLAAARPDTFEPDLAMSLNNLSVHLAAVGRRDDALAAIQEAVSIRRRLAAARPDAFEPDLAASLNNLSVRLAAVGRRDDALAAIQEAVEVYRRLAAARPDAFEPDLAASLNNLSNRLAAVGRRDDALAAIQEAVEVYRRLAAARPDAFEPDLAMSLNNLSVDLAAVGRRDDALAAVQEAVDIRRRLAAVRPDAFEPDLAMSLNNLSNRLAAVGRRDDALAAVQEAVEVRRRLAAARPDAFEPDLAGSLNNLSNRLAAVGRRDEALAAVQEAVGIRRRLAAARPDAFEPDLAMSLNNLSVRLAAVGHPDEALAAAEEAVRRLAGHFLRNPLGFAGWMQTMAGVYIQRCQEAGVEPDAALLQPIEEMFHRLRGGDDPPEETDA